MKRLVRRTLRGTLAASLVAGSGRQRGALGRGGAIAASAVGGGVVGGGGWGAGALLVLFFASSSLLSRLSEVRRPKVAARGAERDAVQVLANGGVAALIAAAIPVVPRGWAGAGFGGLAGAIAAATADTWATEVGAFSRTPPRLVVNGRRVAPGTSGGVTPLGSLAAVAGAAAIAAGAGAITTGATPGRAGIAFAGTATAGIAGSFADSLLGATLQAAYRCPRCDLPTERRVHGCGTPTRLVRGHPVVTNDVVNAAATAVGAAVGIAVARG